jgi:hypothetical protein
MSTSHNTDVLLLFMAATNISIGRISTSPANGLFMSKYQETLNRALNLRRLSYIIYSGRVDQYSLQLPSVQEKLVELLKLEQTELVHVEVGFI